MQGYWKAPIAYFLTNTLTAAVQTELVKHAIDELAIRGISVVSVTMDGHASNVNMCKLLGCVFDPSIELKTWFFEERNNMKIQVIFDPCHMLKLFRNMLEAYGVIRSAQGEISWSYIKDLYKAQEDIGVRAANRLTSHHIEFKNHKMKVSLAAQTLSRSVAIALNLMHDNGDPRFKGAMPTVEFLLIVDKLFDIMNSRSPKAKGLKGPVGNSNLLHTLEVMEECKQYLLQLKMLDGKSLLGSKRFELCYDSLIPNVLNFY